MGFLRSFLKGIGSSEETEKPGPWLVPYVEALGGLARPPEHADEEGFIEGAASDGIPWTLRILSRKEPDTDSPVECHHILWQTDAVRLEDVVLVFGSSDRDADLWVGLDGLAVERLSGINRDGPMSSFVAKAKPFALPYPLSSPWHALTTDPVAAARLLAPTVVVRVEEWRAKAETFETWLRAWVGGPNVRLETHLVDPEPHTYRSAVEVGLALTRAARARGGADAAPGVGRQPTSHLGQGARSGSNT